MTCSADISLHLFYLVNYVGISKGNFMLRNFESGDGARLTQRCQAL